MSYSISKRIWKKILKNGWPLDSLLGIRLKNDYFFFMKIDDHYSIIIKDYMLGNYYEGVLCRPYYFNNKQIRLKINNNYSIVNKKDYKDITKKLLKFSKLSIDFVKYKEEIISYKSFIKSELYAKQVSTKGLLVGGNIIEPNTYEIDIVRAFDKDIFLDKNEVYKLLGIEQVDSNKYWE